MPLRCFLPFFLSRIQVIHEGLKAQLTDAPQTLRQVSNHGLVFVGIIGGAALVICAFWLSVIRTCKLKTNIASSESAPLLNPDQPPTHSQVSMPTYPAQRD